MKGDDMPRILMAIILAMFTATAYASCGTTAEVEVEALMYAKQQGYEAPEFVYYDRQRSLEIIGITDKEAGDEFGGLMVALYHDAKVAHMMAIDTNQMRCKTYPEKAVRMSVYREMLRKAFGTGA